METDKFGNPRFRPSRFPRAPALRRARSTRSSVIVLSEEGSRFSVGEQGNVRLYRSFWIVRRPPPAEKREPLRKIRRYEVVCFG